MNALRCGLALGAVLFIHPATSLANPKDSVVKIAATIRFPNPSQPWTKGTESQSSGTGVVIEGNRVLTNAHVVLYGIDITVEDPSTGQRADAKLQSIDPDFDLAVLTIADQGFFKNRPPLPMEEELPAIQSGVQIFGFPVGGNAMSVTRGEVSRVEIGAYGRGYGAIIQVNAPVNPGNSGGPAIIDGKMIGIVRSRIQNAQNIGLIVPTKEIERFLKQGKNGEPEGKAGFAFQLSAQPLENRALRRKFAIEDDDVRGVLVQRVSREERPTPLKPFDVVTNIGDYAIDNTGFTKLKNGLRASMFSLVPQLAKNGEVEATIWRKGEKLSLALPVTTQDRRLLRNYDGEPLSYFIHGPFVFAQVKFNDVNIYLQMNQTLEFDNSPIVARRDDLVKFPGEELVVVSNRMFRHRVTKGYVDPAGKTVKDINGIAIKNLRHLVETLRDCRDEFITIRFVDNFSEVLVFDREELAESTDDILSDNGIPERRRGSVDMMKVWKGAN